MKDLYSILGVDRDCSESDIKQAYRRLASQHHPDKGGDKERFQDIQQAYAVLSDPDRRREYDDPPRASANMPPGFDFDTIFQMFGTRFGDPRSAGATARIQLWITLADVVAGGPRMISVSSPAGQHNIEIVIPAGIDDGTSVRYPRLAPGGIDLVVCFRIRPEPGWIRQDQHLVHDVTISIWDLILGADIKVMTLSGRELSVAVPAATQPGTLLRIKGHGIPHRSSKTSGDLLIRISGRLPDHISPELKDLIHLERNR